MSMEDIQGAFAYLHKWLKTEFKLTDPALSQVAASLLRSHVIADGVPIRIKTGEPLEIGFISSAADGELHGSLNLSLYFDNSLSVETEEYVNDE